MNNLLKLITELVMLKRNKKTWEVRTAVMVNKFSAVKSYQYLTQVTCCTSADRIDLFIKPKTKNFDKYKASWTINYYLIINKRYTHIFSMTTKQFAVTINIFEWKWYTGCRMWFQFLFQTIGKIKLFLLGSFKFKYKISKPFLN